MANKITESDISDLQPNRERPGEAEESQPEAAKKLRIYQSDDEVRSEVSDRKEEEKKKELIVEADAAEDKGSRHTMEDAWVVLLDACLDSPGNLRCVHFAVYDGHGGRLAAEYAKKYSHANVVSAGLPRELMDVKAAKKAILDGFRKTDASLLQESASVGWHDGATAVCVWVLGQTVFIANIGDAKAVLARSSNADGSEDHQDEVGPLKAIVLTREHKAMYPQERACIQKSGGNVSSNGRLQGHLEVSRAFGDRQFKKKESTSSFLGVMVCGGYLDQVMQLIL